jgi:alpha-amylase
MQTASGVRIASFLRHVLVLSAAIVPALASQGPPRVSAGPLWTRGATCYEVFVRSFFDSDGDGIGDLPGLIRKLDYINDGNPASRHSLGARCIWLMPVAESPSYHGYDVTDYYRIEHDYGTAADFKRLVAEAHRRGIRVLVDMVLNHTAADNAWFQAALHDTASPYRKWYRFSRTKPAEKGPWGQEVWHKSPARDEYYYGVFWSGMPDLDYHNAAVRDEAYRIARYWIEEMGVDGFRLDAVPYLVEEPGQSMHAVGTHALLSQYQAYVRSIKPDVFTIGEVWFPNDVLLTYYPEQLESYFAFDVSDSLVAAVQRGTAGGVLAPVLRLQRAVPSWRWAPFLRNHDQTRTRTALGGDPGRVRVAATLLLTLPGLPFVYYGEEIGMTGDKPDERIRTPMQWRAGRGGGFTTGTPWEAFQPDSTTTTVGGEDDDPGSLLAIYRSLIHLRAGVPALTVGDLVPVSASDSTVVAYLRRDGNRAVLVVVNLGGKALDRVALTSANDAAPVGRWRLVDLLGGAVGRPVVVPSDGRLFRYVPLARLAAQTGYVFELR